MLHDNLIASHIPKRINERLATNNFFAHLDLEDFEHDDDPSFGYEKAMIAGASAGVMEHVAMFPIDTIKTRLQAPVPIGGVSYTGAFDAIFKISTQEGIPRLYRGVTAVMIGAIPSHAVNYGAYEYLKEKFGGNLPGHHPIAHAGAGALSTLLHDAIINPMDVIKQRLQVQQSVYRGVITCARTVLKEEGLIAFYASYPTTVLLNVPFMAVYFAGYEFFKRAFGAGSGHHHDIGKELAAGACAGACAGLVSTPLDVLRTRLQTQHVMVGQPRLNTRQMFRSLYQTEGLSVFLKGSTARMMYFMPSAAICWSTYETVKRLLKDAW
jgi:solute carrier family 25 iron transporter 28/37